MTYRELIAAIPESKLDDPVQVVKYHPVEDVVLECLPGICVGTIDDLGLFYVRSSINNTRRGDDFVIIVDHNPHGLDGAIAYEFSKVEEVLSCSKNKPIYGPLGYKPEADWTEDGIAKDMVDLQFNDKFVYKLNKAQITVLQNRIKQKTENYDENKQH